ncbi:MAG: phenylalanine--tRNA ligase subunit beta [Phycisphaerae bacterium]|nr:phenylalanine--tRNA ligase subunit beta [Phycisphaerae bacterium]
MLISLNWLSEYMDVNLPAEKLAELFTRIGLNCDGVEEKGDDIVFDLEVTSNRPDLLGHLGVARELATATGAAFRPPKFDPPAGSGETAELTSVQVLCEDLCPRYTARVIRGVKVGPSPQWLVDHLAAVGMRSVNNVVDVTNFVLMEYSQPLHSFDYDKLAENRIVVRRAKKGETLVSIDETTCELTDSMCVIADAEKPVAIAGVMGALNTEVTEGTTNVLLESAQFDPLTTRRTSRALGILSESSYRFERGVDPVAVEEASARACALICELAGGEAARGLVDVWAKPYEAPSVSLRPSRTNKLLGIEIPVEKQTAILTRLGLSPKKNGDAIVCTIPSHRADLRREADLIEEVARLHGYDEIPALGKVSHRVAPMGKTERIRRLAMNTLSAAGYSEAVTFSFIDAEEAKLFGCDEPVCVDARVRRTNNVLRPTLLPSLLRAVKTNQDVGNADVSLFELAAVFPPGGANGLPAEYIELAMVSTEGQRDVRGAMEAVMRRIAPGAKVTIQPADGFADAILIDGEPAGQIGTISPALTEAIHKHYGLEKNLGAATLRFDALARRAQLTRTTQPLPKFPPIRRDLSLIVDETVPWGELAAALAAVAQPLRVEEKYVTTYRGKPIPKGKKSVTVALEYRSNEGTLTNEQVDQQVRELLTALQKTLAVELRT